VSASDRKRDRVIETSPPERTIATTADVMVRPRQRCRRRHPAPGFVPRVSPWILRKSC